MGRWVPIGRCASLGIDWSAALPTFGAVDPYAVWFDVTGFQSVASATRPPLIAELVRPLDFPAWAELLATGLFSPLHYVWNAVDSTLPAWRFVTLRCTTDDALARLIREVGEGRGPVRRYELGDGSVSPDTLMLEAVLAALRTAPAKPVRERPLKTMVGFVDYGCAFANRAFRNAADETRVEWLLDLQAMAGRAVASPPTLDWKPVPYLAFDGLEASGNELRRFMQTFEDGGVVDEAACNEAALYEPLLREATHGTHIMDIATGFPNPMLPVDANVDPADRHAAPIVFVQLPRFIQGRQMTGLLRAHVLDAVHYAASKLAVDGEGVVNVSYGTYCGPHDGSSILENGIDELLRSTVVSLPDGTSRRRLQTVVPAGNSLDLQAHAQVEIPARGSRTIRLQNLPDDPSDTFVELWFDAGSKIDVRLESPDEPPDTGVWVSAGEAKVLRSNPDDEPVAAVVSAKRVCQSDRGRMVLVAIAPTADGGTRAPAPYGEWRISLRNDTGQAITVDAWCEKDDPVFGTEGVVRQARILDAVTKTGTLNSIAHGSETIVAGGYVLHGSGPIAMYSGTGPGRGLPGRQRNHAVARDAPDVLGPCDFGIGEEGIDASGVLSGTSLRLPGTSVAAATITRGIVENGFQPLPGWGSSGKESPRRPPPDDEHPDETLSISRWP